MKSAKRLLRANLSPSGSLDNDKLLRALLQLRNTPDPDCHVSPAQIIFGRPIRDAFSFINRLEKFSNKNVHPTWREVWSAKESALRTRFVKTSEALNGHCKTLGRLVPGDKCFIQNQTGNSPKRWDRTGTVVEVKPHDQYIVKVDGSGRLTTRNRRFLRHFERASMEIQCAPPSYPTSTPAPRDAETTVPPNLDQPDASTIVEELMPDVPIIEESNSQGKTVDESESRGKPLPLALRRLLPHNKQGSKEDMKAPDQGGRARRGASREQN